MDQPVGRILVLTSGHVEETALSSLVLWHPGGFTNVEIALSLVGRVLLEVAEKMHQRKYVGPPCPHCKKLPEIEDTGPNREELARLFQAFCNTTVDGASGFIQGLMDCGFEFPQYDTPPEHWTRLVNVLQYADDILADVALGRTTEPDDQGWFHPAYDWNRHVLKPEDLPWDMPKT